jgi:hypothetical protein
MSSFQPAWALAASASWFSSDRLADKFSNRNIHSMVSKHEHGSPVSQPSPAVFININLYSAVSWCFPIWRIGQRDMHWPQISRCSASDRHAGAFMVWFIPENQRNWNSSRIRIIILDHKPWIRLSYVKLCSSNPFSCPLFFYIIFSEIRFSNGNPLRLRISYGASTILTRNIWLTKSDYINWLQKATTATNAFGKI